MHQVQDVGTRLTISGIHFKCEAKTVDDCGSVVRVVKEEKKKVRPDTKSISLSKDQGSSGHRLSLAQGFIVTLTGQPAFQAAMLT